jgi:hypothetical protein
MRAPALTPLLAGLLLLGSVASAAEPTLIDGINPLIGTLALQDRGVHQGITLAVGKRNAHGGTLAGDPRRGPLAALDLLARLGRVKLDDKGDPLFYEHLLVQTQDGRDVVAYPAKRATGPASPN